MKKIVLLIGLLISFSCAFTQNWVNYTASLFYNSTTTPQTVQVTLFVQNTGNGNVTVDFAAIQFSIRYNSTYFSLQSYSMYPSGSGLDATGDSNPSQPDATSTTSITIGGKNYQSLNITRSTNLCANVTHLAPNSAPIPVFVAIFKLLTSPSYYDFTTSSATKYPAEFQIAGSPTTAYRDILMSANSSYDQNGTSGSCHDGNINLKALGDDSNTPTSFYNSNAPLPVTWRSFTAYRDNRSVYLKWATNNEINTQGFEIERKVNNVFEKVGYVASKAPGGNSNNELNYEFTDATLAFNTSAYYRIKEIAMGKVASYSEVKFVNVAGKQLQVMIYPNPSYGNINVVLPAESTDLNVTVTDYAGKVVRTFSKFNNTNLQISGLAKGLYFIRVVSAKANETVTQKITVF